MLYLLPVSTRSHELLLQAVKLLMLSFGLQRVAASLEES